MNNLLCPEKKESFIKGKVYRDICILMVILGIIAAVGYANRPFTIISPLPMNPNFTVVKKAQAQEPVTQDYTSESIEKYVRTIFGKDSKVAIAVSHNECNPRNRLYPTCHETITNKEYSVGIFQINIKSEYAKVHYDRIPGGTLEEKIEWLKDPYNNTLFAYWIFKTSGWNPWTAYTNGSYLSSL